MMTSDISLRQTMMSSLKDIYQAENSKIPHSQFSRSPETFEAALPETGAHRHRTNLDHGRGTSSRRGILGASRRGGRSRGGRSP